MEPDLKNPLHLWLIAICRAHYGKRSIKEVVNMDTALKNFYETDPGFAQYVDRFDLVAADPKVVRAYKKWCANDLWFKDAIGKLEAMAEARGEAKKKAEADARIAKAKAESEASKAKAEAEASKAKAEAEASRAKAEARIAEADAKIAEAKAEAKASKELELAKNALRQVNPGQSFTDTEKLLRSCGISEEVIKVAVTEVNNERSGKK
jgi:hypothetical protein